MRLVRSAAISIIGAGLLAMALPAYAQEEQEGHPTFLAEMSGFQETPATPTLAKGFAGIQVSHDGNTVYYSIAVTDASTNLVAAHLHFGAPGVAGPIVVTLCSPTTTPCQTEGMVAQGSFTADKLEGPFLNDTLDRLINEARAGNVYANVHSTKFPNGEARGQLVDLGSMTGQPEPAPEAAEPME